jgi:hypothetical protein
MLFVFHICNKLPLRKAARPQRSEINIEIFIYMVQICSIRGRPILLNPDNHFTQRNMPNLLDSKFSQRNINELLNRFTVRNPCFTRYARNVSFILHSINFFISIRLLSYGHHFTSLKLQIYNTS